jgi:hypothetical protein
MINKQYKKIGLLFILPIVIILIYHYLFFLFHFDINVIKLLRIIFYAFIIIFSFFIFTRFAWIVFTTPPDKMWNRSKEEERKKLYPSQKRN